MEDEARLPKCQSCASNCKQLVPRYERCKVKGQRLCDLVHTGILHHRYDLSSLDDYKAAHDALLRGTRELEERSIQRFPRSEEIFVVEARYTHEILFQYAVPNIAGRFRNSHELSEFGGSGRNKMEGSSPDKIVADLPNAYRLATHATWDHIQRSAAFLERLFRIHPFVDGNGRIGRHFVQRICRANGKTVPKWDDSPASRREYIAALEAAHASLHHKRTGEGLDLLRRWLARQVQDVAPDDF